MSEYLKLIPLGGAGEFGKNMMVLEHRERLMVIDAGIGFPENDQQIGVDVLVPNFNYLRQNVDRLDGIFLTHGHEDHIGALPHLLREVNVPLFGTPLTLGFVRAKLNGQLREEVAMTTVDPGDRIDVGPFNVEAIAVNHSIPASVGLGIRTAAGNVYHSGDYKFDHTPIDGRVTDFAALARLGDEGVKLLISDITNIDRPGHTPSEAVVGDAFESLFPLQSGRIIIATFASQIHRIQQAFDVAAMTGRKVLVAGRSMERNVNVAIDLGYLHVPDGLRIGYDELSRLPDREVLIIITGSQGEPVSGLARMSQGNHPRLRIHDDDTVILSATPIPGNEATVWGVINGLMRMGAKVITFREAQVHVSGHASSEEIKLLFNLIRPQYAVPYQSEYRHQMLFGAVAQDVGLRREDIFLLQNGDVLSIDGEGARLEPSVEHGIWTVDGNRINELGTSDQAVQDRIFLAESGVITGAVAWDYAAGEAMGRPQVGLRGVRAPEDDPESEALLAGAVERLVERFAQLDAESRRSPAEVTRAGRRALRSYFEKATRTYPVLQFLVVGINEPPEGAPGEAEADDEEARATTLSVDGEVKRPAALALEDLAGLEPPDWGVPSFDNEDWQAVNLRVLLESRGLHSRATHVTLANEADGFSASLPLAAVLNYGWLVHGVDDQPLPEDEGGPVRFVVIDPPDEYADELAGCTDVGGIRRVTATVGPGRDNRKRG